jgi:hypothetical protein
LRGTGRSTNNGGHSVASRSWLIASLDMPDSNTREKEHQTAEPDGEALLNFERGCVLSHVIYPPSTTLRRS